MRIEGQGSREGRIGEQAHAAVAVREEKRVAGPRKGALVCLYVLGMGGDGAEGCAVELDQGVILVNSAFNSSIS